MSVETCKCVSCNDELCPHDDTFITKPKYTGWTVEDDYLLLEALEFIGLNGSEKWTAQMRLTGVYRLSINWMMEDIKRAQERIRNIVNKALNQFVDDNKMVKHD